MERTDFEQWKAREVARLLALVETERRYYQEMVASLPVALVVLAADRSIISANRAFRRTFGMSSEDLRRRTLDQIIPSPRLIERIRDAHVHGIAQPDLFVDLEDRSLRVAIVPIRNWDDEGELETLLMIEDLRSIAHMLTRTQAAIIDAKAESQREPEPETSLDVPPFAPIEPSAETEVAEHATAPAAPEEPAKAAARVITDLALPAVVWRASLQTFQFTFVSGAAERLLGYPAAHWLESPGFFSERIHPDDREATLLFYAAACARPGDASAEYRAISATGAVIWCRETIRVPAPNEVADEAEPGSISGIITDITLRKQLEEQLLTAERHDALRGLSSRLSHDLNNPLMIITGYGEEMLESLPASDARHDDIKQILDASERISGITGQLLGFTRKLAQPPQPVEIGHLIASMDEKIAQAVGEAVTVETTSAGEPVWALADPGQLEEIVLAILSSARADARERTRVTIGWEIDAIAEALPESTLRAGTYARILIHDNGRGADAARRTTMFESVLGKDEAGAGLAKAYAMVHEWGGDIAFTSEPYRGSTFMLYLPYAPPEPPPVEIRVETSAASSEAPTPAAAPIPEAATVPLAEPVEPPRETILLVEDEAGIRALVRKILKRERYVVIEAGSGEEAIVAARSHKGAISLLVTDVILPGVGGRDLAESLTKTIPGLRVLYISGYTDDEAVRAGWFPPGSRFLQKPFTLGALVKGVREALDSE